METINKNTYFKLSLNSENITELGWYYSMFTIQDIDNIDSKFLRKGEYNGKSCLEVKSGNNWYVLVSGDKIVTEFPIMKLTDTLTLTKEDLSNIEGSVDTTYGRAIFNRVLLVHSFNNKIGYINEPISLKKVEKIITTKMVTDEIVVKEYVKFADACSFLRGLTRITNVSATYKNVLPPPDLDKHKTRLFKEFTEKYGEDWVKDRTKIVEYQAELKKIDADWLADDPSNGKLITGKIKDNARMKMYLTFGPEVGFDKSGETMTFVSNSLSDGYPEDKEQLTAMFNSSRSGSYDRGKETQKGGAAAKDMLRSTIGYNIKGEDCGATRGKQLLVSKVNADKLLHRYMLIGNKTVKIEDPHSLIGKTIVLRSPMYCNNKDSSFCVTCVGDSMGIYKNGVSLGALEISNILLNASMKSMHNTQVKLLDYNILDTIS